MAILVPRSYAPLPPADSVLTRRAANGIAAHGLIVPTLHTFLERHRPCAVHAVDWATPTAGQTWQTRPLPGAPLDQIRVPVTLSDRAEHLLILVQYRADPGCLIAVTMATLAGVAWGSEPGFAWDESVGTLTDTRTFSGNIFSAQPYTWAWDVVTTGETPAPTTAGTPRPLVVDPAARGTTVQVVLTATAAQIFSAAVYEMSEDQVTP